MARRVPQKVCPEKCSGGYADRQHALTDQQLAELDDSTRQRIGQSTPTRCNYCGTVYLYGGTVLGWLDSGIIGEGWHPRK